MARPRRTFATNNSPATAAWARTGSGRDHRDATDLLRLKFIWGLQRGLRLIGIRPVRQSD